MTESYDGLTQLGHHITAPQSPDEAKLERVPNPHSEVPYLMVGERQDFGMAHSGSDDLMHIWVVHGSTLQEDFWFIYADVSKETNS